MMMKVKHATNFRISQMSIQQTDENYDDRLKIFTF